MGNRRIILELDREPQDLQAVWRLDSIARLIQQALFRDYLSKASDVNIRLDQYRTDKGTIFENKSSAIFL